MKLIKEATYFVLVIRVREGEHEAPQLYLDDEYDWTPEIDRAVALNSDDYARREVARFGMQLGQMSVPIEYDWPTVLQVTKHATYELEDVVPA